MWSVFFVLLSYLDREMVRADSLSRAVDAEKENKEMFSMINGTFCAKMSLLGENVLYQVSDGAEVVRTVVSPAGKLVNCSVTVNQMEVKSFMHECRLGLRDQRAGTDTRAERMDQAKVTCQDFKERPERRVSSPAVSVKEERAPKRSKRGFTYPGTLWCGAGNMADHFNQLGEFSNTDSCCRTHDHCPHVIHAFSSKYGYTNFKWHSICHCDCDNELKACLRTVNDTSSRVVGQAFFNVIGVPCFEFTYEEQCAERHWYGLCKRYEMLPIAVLREAVPYDYGGISVIDELTLAPPKQKDSEKSDKKEQPETPTQSTMSGPDEPSLRNVVTAAEDFIKVLATVSTSQSSNADSDKGETQSSEKKKKKKNKGKNKKNKKQKGEGKGKKRKHKMENARKAQEKATVQPANTKAEDVLALSNFLSEANRHGHSSTGSNRIDEKDLKHRSEDEPSNEVMKDEPAAEKETVLVSTDQKSPRESDRGDTKQEVISSEITIVNQHRIRDRKKNCERKKSKKTTCNHEKLILNSVDHLVFSRVPTALPTLTSMPEQLLSTEELAVRATIVLPKAKRNRSKERSHKEGREKKRVCSDAPVVSAEQQNSSVDRLIAPPEAPTTSPVRTSDKQLLLGPYGHWQNNQVTAQRSTLSILKRRRSQERELKKGRKKMPVPPSGESLPSHSGSENVTPVLSVPHTRVAPLPSGRTRTIQAPQTHSEWPLSATVTPTVSTNLHWHPSMQQGRSVPEPTKPQTRPTLAFGASTAEDSWKSTSALPSMSPLQLSIEKAKAQFTRKKLRKALRWKRHH